MWYKILKNGQGIRQYSVKITISAVIISRYRYVRVLVRSALMNAFTWGQSSRVFLGNITRVVHQMKMKNEITGVTLCFVFFFRFCFARREEKEGPLQTTQE